MQTILIALRVENYLGNLFYGIEKKMSIIYFIKNFFFNLIRYIIIKKADAVVTGGYKDKYLIHNGHQKKIYLIAICY